jgi:hypothetical protein
MFQVGFVMVQYILVKTVKYTIINRQCVKFKAT